jgi:hypothetical protein
MTAYERYERKRREEQRMREKTDIALMRILGITPQESQFETEPEKLFFHRKLNQRKSSNNSKEETHEF